MVILFIDLLGTKSRWVKGGRESVTKVCDEFVKLITTAIASADAKCVSTGGVESDSCALLYDDPVPAIRCAGAAFAKAFRSATRPTDDRLWLRGVLLPFTNKVALRKSSHLTTAISNVERVKYADGLLEALNIEKSGYKGMRLLVADEVLTPTVRNQFKVVTGNEHLIPFRRLDHSFYPKRVEKGYSDFLWMASTQVDWTATQITMASRLRWSVRDSEEFLQAASTQVVFNECAAIIAQGSRHV